ncbi:uncharacterized protein LOC142634869 [Castanea sativa]|uniref:uncharacterized protein LOC142634869 n=1 Tax=Castanea sativa TaxID=21020 RepID=UPI003F64F050
MQKYLKLTKHLAWEFNKLDFVRIPKDQNMAADEIAKMASSKEKPTNGELLMEIQKRPSIEEVLIFSIQSINSWMAPIMSFLQDGHLPRDALEARRIKMRAARFTILNDTLYKMGFSMPYLKCVNEEEAKYILREVHEGICGDYAGLRSLVSKVIQTGYFWPTMQVDTAELVNWCDKCQRFGNVQRLPAEKMTTITSPWPFAQWGIDIIDPLPLRKGQVRFLLVNIDYFTKWVEAETIGTITEAWIRSFVWKNIICRFGIPRTIISDNGRQFDSQGFKDFSSGLGIRNQFSYPGPNSRTQDTHRLTYGTEVVIPVEVGVASVRREVFREKDNNDQLRINLDYLDEIRDKASNKTVKYQRKMTEYYNKRVKLRLLEIGDLVLRKVSSVVNPGNPIWQSNKIPPRRMYIANEAKRFFRKPNMAKQ